MADREYKYTVSDFALSSTITYGDFGSEVIELNGSRTTKSFATSNIALANGESVKKIVVTANYSINGSQWGYTLTVNNLPFSGLRKLSQTNFIEGRNYDVSFYFCLANQALGDGALTTPESSTTKTMYFTNVTLTVTVGAGNAFDGKVSSLNEGDKIYIKETDQTTAVVTGNNVNMRSTPSTSGSIITSVPLNAEVTILEYESGWTKVAYGSYVGYISNTYLDLPITSTPLYTLVHHEYNPGKALIFRDAIYGTSQYRSSTSYNGYNGSKLDTYLTSTFYPSLPSETTQFLQPIDYQIRSGSNSTSTATTISRTAATISASETGLGGSTSYGAVLNCTDTVGIGEVYWTREPLVGYNNYAYGVSAANTVANYGIANSYGVRPTLGVSEDQLVMYSESDGGYVFCTRCSSPSTLYVNGSATNVADLNSGDSLTLTWSEGAAGYNVPISGYAVWYSTAEDGEYTLYGVTTERSMGIFAPQKGFQTYYFKVQTLAPEELDYCNSELSSSCCSVATKRTNVSYFDNAKWKLATVKYYNGSRWIQIDGVKHYDGSEWTPYIS